MILRSMNHIQILLFMLNKVNVRFLRQFLGFYSVSKLTIWLNHVAFFVSLLFRILRSLNHKYKSLFILNKVNVMPRNCNAFGCQVVIIDFC